MCSVPALVNALCYVFCIAFNALAMTVKFNGNGPSDVSHKYPTAFTPRGYAFSIWSVIFIGLGILTVVQMLPANKSLSRALFRYGMFPINLIACGLWNVVFGFELLTLSVIVILVVLGTGIWLVVHVSIPRVLDSDQGAQRGNLVQVVDADSAPCCDVSASSTLKLWTVDWVLDIYVGWVSVATIANLAILCVSISWDLWREEWFAVLVVILLLPVYLALYFFSYALFPLSAAWAIAAIGLNLHGSGSSAVVVVAGLLLAGSVLVSELYRVTRNRQRNSNQRNSNSNVNSSRA